MLVALSTNNPNRSPDCSSQPCHIDRYVPVPLMRNLKSLMLRPESAADVPMLPPGAVAGKIAYVHQADVGGTIPQRRFNNVALRQMP